MGVHADGKIKLVKGWSVNMEASDVLVVLIGSALVVIGVFLILRRYVFLKNRCTAQTGGKILDVERTERQRDVDSSKTVSYYMKYHYFVSGVEYAKRRRVSKRQYRAAGKHDSFTVFYDPSKPKRHYVAELKFRIFFTLLLIALGVVILYYSYSNVLLI